MRRVWVSSVLAVAAGVAAVVVPLLLVSSVPAAASACREPTVSVWDPISGAWECVWNEDRYGPCPPARCSGHLPTQSPPPSTSSRRPVPPDTWQDLPERVPVSHTSPPSPWPHRIGVAAAVVVGAAAVLWLWGYIEVRAEMRAAALDEADDDEDDEDADEPDGSAFADSQPGESVQQQEHQLLMDELIADELRRMRGQDH
ncbi:hypothetical protein [[Mycobacterium] vasticus]|uniref:Uncharacterized protein n=1 Tax=[Mycobacterium] vasticus TaxID=2875777 RepID=A0ABU5Z3K4_9MYCO|nr:hypothetical protein [Mycolicibacter sp. MYC017]MEB3071958.1 hypothetical protein [Mycolicibacter sp. MYC017]